MSVNTNCLFIIATAIIPFDIFTNSLGRIICICSIYPYLFFYGIVLRVCGCGYHSIGYRPVVIKKGQICTGDIDYVNVNIDHQCESELFSNIGMLWPGVHDNNH